MSAITATPSTLKLKPEPKTLLRGVHGQFHTTPYKKASESISRPINNVTCDVINPWVKKDLERFDTVYIDDYLEYILERCLQPADAVKLSEGDDTPLVKAVYRKIFAALEENKKDVGQIHYSLRNYAEIPKETDHYAPWVEATNAALDVLKTVHVENIREPSLLNILAQRNDLNEVPISHGSDESVRKPDVVFMTEEELIEVHKINKTASDWQTTLKTRCQDRLPENSVQWRQFKATVEFKRHKENGDRTPVTFPNELRSCSEGSDSYVKPQSLGKSVSRADDAPATPSPEPEEAVWDPVPKASGSRKRVHGGAGAGPCRIKGLVTEGMIVKSARTGITHRTPHSTLNVKVPMVQAAGYAAEIMSDQMMTHTHGCVIEDMTMWSWWYDRQGAIQTSGFNFAKDLPRFLILLFAWQRFTKQDWGIVLEGQSLTCDGDVEITLTEDVVHRPYGIIGRGSLVLRATSTSRELKGLPLVVKSSWPEANRTSETEILDTIKEQAGHLPEVADHILHYAAKKSTDYSTSHIRGRLGLDTKGARKLTIIVFEELDGDISNLNGLEMWDVAYRLDKCNHALWRLGIQHRDISVPNMMYKRIHGKLRAYLIDFDLASLAGHVSHNLDRTGTIPFMALELLDSASPEGTAVMHAYEHDAEAVCWILLWLGVQYEGGNRMNHAFESWEMIDAVTCYEKKLSLLGHLHLKPFTGRNRLLQEPVRGILRKFAMHYTSRLYEPYPTRPSNGGNLPPIHKWLEESDKEIRFS